MTTNVMSVHKSSHNRARARLLNKHIRCNDNTVSKRKDIKQCSSVEACSSNSYNDIKCARSHHEKNGNPNYVEVEDVGVAGRVKSCSDSLHRTFDSDCGDYYRCETVAQHSHSRILCSYMRLVTDDY